MIEEDHAQLIKKIEEAFKNNTYPGDDHIVAITRKNDDEPERIAAAFKGRDWKNMPSAVLLANPSSLAFFTPEAFHFYLPAYLIATLTKPGEMGTAFSNTLYSLIPPNADSDETDINLSHMTDRFLTRINMLTTEQKNIVKEFIVMYKRLYYNPVTYDLFLEKAVNFWETYK